MPMPATALYGPKEMIRYAVRAYGFLLGPGSWSYGDLAKAIKGYYCLENPVNAAVYDFLIARADARYTLSR